VTPAPRPQESPIEPAERSAWTGIWSLYGVSVARQDQGDDSAFSIGVELSDAHVLPSTFWWGYYADLRYSHLARGIDLSVGAEVGFNVIGIDAGLYARVGRNSAIGFRGRGCLSVMAVVSFCVGGGYTTDGGFIEGGLLLKYGRRRRDGDEEAHRGEEEERVEELGSEPDPYTERGIEQEPPTFRLDAPMGGEDMGIDGAELEESVDPSESGGETE
jgi:hypothetical protein